VREAVLRICPMIGAEHLGKNSECQHSIKLRHHGNLQRNSVEVQAFLTCENSTSVETQEPCRKFRVLHVSQWDTHSTKTLHLYIIETHARHYTHSHHFLE
jgi:hypothetical protein